VEGNSISTVAVEQGCVASTIARFKLESTGTVSRLVASPAKIPDGPPEDWKISWVRFPAPMVPAHTFTGLVWWTITSTNEICAVPEIVLPPVPPAPDPPDPAAPPLAPAPAVPPDPAVPPAPAVPAVPPVPALPPVPPVLPAPVPAVPPPPEVPEVPPLPPVAEAPEVPPDPPDPAAPPVPAVPPDSGSLLPQPITEKPRNTPRRTQLAKERIGDVFVMRSFAGQGCCGCFIGSSRVGVVVRVGLFCRCFEVLACTNVYNDTLWGALG
jgi:hypothetical protein